MKIVPAYTLPQTGPATRAAVDRYLAAPRLMRLGVTEPDGTPLVHPVWYTWEQDQFLLHIPTRSPKRTAIEAQPTVYFTVADKGPGIFGVRGKARAAIDPDGERLRRVIQDQWDRYTGGSDTCSTSTLIPRGRIHFGRIGTTKLALRRIIDRSPSPAVSPHS